MREQSHPRPFHTRLIVESVTNLRLPIIYVIGKKHFLCSNTWSSGICWVDFCNGHTRTSPWRAQQSPKHGRTFSDHNKIKTMSSVHVRAKVGRQIQPTKSMLQR